MAIYPILFERRYELLSYSTWMEFLFIVIYSRVFCAVVDFGVLYGFADLF